jgi:uncharacterized cupin superfamily protein
MPNLREPDFDDQRDHPGFRCRRARLGRQAGSVRLGMSLWEVPPGEAAYPYHLHLVEEELVVVLEGRPSLRDPSGWRELREGEVVAFPAGEAGAHQIANRTDHVVRLLSISTAGVPDVILQLDSGKLGAYERRPEGGGLREWYRRSDAVDYWEGERPPVD